MQKWYFNGMDLCTKAWGVEAVLDGLGPPGFRGSDLQIPFKNGKKHVKKRYESKNLILAMWVVGFDPATGRVPAGKTIMEALDDNIDFLSSLFGKSGQFPLSRNMRSGEIRIAEAEVYSKVNFVPQGAGYSKFTVEFELADPLFYTNVLVEDTQTISTAAKVFTHINPGTAQITDMKITLTGPLNNPKIVNLFSNISLQYLGVLNEGETVILKTSDFSCLKGEASMVSGIKHSGDANWMIIESGSNSIEIASDTPGGSFKIEYYPAYF